MFLEIPDQALHLNPIFYFPCIRALPEKNSLFFMTLVSQRLFLSDSSVLGPQNGKTVALAA